MAKRFEAIAIILCMLFIVAISLYHIAQDGDWGLTQRQWRVVWAISENALLLTMGIVIVVFAYGTLRRIFKCVFIPYFTAKLIYQFSCFSGIYIFSPDTWRNIWGIICVLILLVGLIIFLKKEKDDNKIFKEKTISQDKYSLPDNYFYRGSDSREIVINT